MTTITTLPAPILEPVPVPVHVHIPVSVYVPLVGILDIGYQVVNCLSRRTSNAHKLCTCGHAQCTKVRGVSSRMYNSTYVATSFVLNSAIWKPCKFNLS